MIATEALTGGFADPVFESQAVFRGVLDALSRPGRIVTLALKVVPPAPLGPAAAAIVAALADEGTPVYLDRYFAEHPAVAAWIAFHTGAPVTASPTEAAFALLGDLSEMPRLAEFAMGTAEYPDRSTMVILQVAGFDGPDALRLAGPGVPGTASISPVPLPADFLAQMRANRALFPRGVDLALVAGSRIAALPRSVRILEPEA